jgi:hypothetical protein
MADKRRASVKVLKLLDLTNLADDLLARLDRRDATQMVSTY